MKKKTIALILIALLCVGMTGCSSSPEGIAKSFMDSVVNGSTEKALSYCKDPVEGQLLVGMVATAVIDEKAGPFSYETVDQEEGFAEVHVHDPNGHFCKIELEKINGNWKVAYLY